MNIFCCSILLVILLFEKLKSSPLPFDNVNDSNYDASPWSRDDKRPSDSLDATVSHTTSVEFEPENNEFEASTAKNNYEGNEEDDYIEVRISKNYTKNDDSGVQENSENTPSSKILKSFDQRHKNKGNKEVVPDYAETTNDKQPTFFIRTKRKSTSSPKIHVLTNEPPHDKIIEDVHPVEFVRSQKSRDKTDEDSTKSDIDLMQNKNIITTDLSITKTTIEPNEDTTTLKSTENSENIKDPNNENSGTIRSTVETTTISDASLKNNQDESTRIYDKTTFTPHTSSITIIKTSENIDYSLTPMSEISTTLFSSTDYNVPTERNEILVNGSNNEKQSESTMSSVRSTKEKDKTKYDETTKTSEMSAENSFTTTRTKNEEQILIEMSTHDDAPTTTDTMNEANTETTRQVVATSVPRTTYILTEELLTTTESLESMSSVVEVTSRKFTKDASFSISTTTEPTLTLTAIETKESDSTTQHTNLETNTVSAKDDITTHTINISSTEHLTTEEALMDTTPFLSETTIQSVGDGFTTINTKSNDITSSIGKTTNKDSNVLETLSTSDELEKSTYSLTPDETSTMTTDSTIEDSKIVTVSLTYPIETTTYLLTPEESTSKTTFETQEITKKLPETTTTAPLVTTVVDERITYVLMAEPETTSELPKMTSAISKESTEAASNQIMTSKESSFASTTPEYTSTITTLFDDKNTNLDQHQESLETKKRSIAHTTEHIVTTTMIPSTETPKDVISYNSGHKILPFTEEDIHFQTEQLTTDDSKTLVTTTETVLNYAEPISSTPKTKLNELGNTETTSDISSTDSAKTKTVSDLESTVRSTYILTPEELTTTTTMNTETTNLEQSEKHMSTNSIETTTHDILSTTLPITEQESSSLTTTVIVASMEVQTTSPYDQTTNKILQTTTEDTSTIETTAPTTSSTYVERTTYILTAQPIDVTSPKESSNSITHDDVTDSGLHEESLGTNKRSIGETNVNDLTPSSSTETVSRSTDRSTEKISLKTTETSNQVITTEEGLSNTLKYVETTLETPLTTEPSLTTTTTETPSTTTTTENPTTTTTTENPTTSTTTKTPTTKTKPITEVTTESANTSLITEPTITSSTKEIMAIEKGSVYGTNHKQVDDTTQATISTTQNTNDESFNTSRDNENRTIPVNQCNTSPVFSKGDTIVGGSAINDINVPEKDKKNKEEEKIELCTSTECVHSASRMLSRMNLKIDPCTNFYEFACGRFLDETHVPSEKSNVDIFVTINDKLQQQLQILLSAPIDKDKDIMPVQIVKTLFAACMNRDLIEERGTKPLMDLLHLLGGWPILIGDSWNSEHWAWTYTIARMKLLGVGIDYIMELSVTNDFANSSKRIVYLDQAVTELDREFLLNGWNDTNVQAYFEYIKDVAIFLGAEKETADREAREIVNFEISLGHISASKESRRELHSLYNPITIRDLQHKYPYINWLEYINFLLPHKARVTNDQIISLADKTFFKKLGPLLDNTPKRVLANYLLWHAVDSSIGYLTESLQKIELRYRSKTNGKDELDPQWKECVISIAPRFKVAIGAQYAREYFREDSKKVAVEMVNDIKEAFAEIIQSRDWMDEDTKSAAMEKLQKMSVNIAYPNELMDDNIVTEYYKGLHVKEDEYYESALRSYAFLTDKALDRLHDPVNKTDWRDLAYVAVVNAFYHPLSNYIMFPAGILQEHFFQADRPKYMNYAAIGFVIGHEITHGFDDMGAQFDIEGNLRQWWQNETLQAYTTRAQCIIDQYGNFTDPEVNVTLNGFATQGENIADNGGLKEAYIAYQKWVQKYGEEPGLPGLNYTSNQLFWISAAQNWCSKYKPESLKYTIITDSHSPGRFRVMGPFMNSVAFSNDFECPSGSPMNPEKKCEVW